MAWLHVRVMNGPEGNSNPPDDTIWIQLLRTGPGGLLQSWVQNYRPGWKTDWFSPRNAPRF